MTRRSRLPCCSSSSGPLGECHTARRCPRDGGGAGGVSLHAPCQLACALFGEKIATARAVLMRFRLACQRVPSGYTVGFFHTCSKHASVLIHELSLLRVVNEGR